MHVATSRRRRWKKWSAGSARMASYRVSVRGSAERDLRKIDSPTATKIWASIRALETDPLPRHSVKLVGSRNHYRLRIGEYRILYELDHGDRFLEVFRIAHRREAYR
jgi:mRNA interferase RelE/StbE